MTWNELADFICQMPPEQLYGDVRFVEPYDKEQTGFVLSGVYACEDLMVGGGGEQEEVFVRQGEPFLE